MKKKQKLTKKPLTKKPKKVSKKSKRKSALKKSAKPISRTITIHSIAAFQEKACMGGNWRPSVTINSSVSIGDILGSITLSGIKCEVEASNDGVVDWVRPAQPVKSSYVVCMIRS